MPPRAPSTPKKKNKAGRTQTPRQRTPVTRSHSLRPSRSPSLSPPPIPTLPQSLSGDTDPGAREWFESLREADPVFRSQEQQDAVARACGCSIQPPEHCYPEFFPAMAAKFGFKRWVPDTPLRVGSKGPKCIVGGVSGLNCHKPCLPAFLYEQKKVICSVMKEKKQRTLIFRWWYDDEGRMGLNACWGCHTSSGRQRCPLIDQLVEPLRPVPLDATTESMAALSASVMHTSGAKRDPGHLEMGEREGAMAFGKRLKGSHPPDDSILGPQIAFTSAQSAKPDDTRQAQTEWAPPVDAHQPHMSTGDNLAPSWRGYAQRMMSRDRSRTPGTTQVQEQSSDILSQDANRATGASASLPHQASPQKEDIESTEGMPDELPAPQISNDSPAPPLIGVLGDANLLSGWRAQLEQPFDQSLRMARDYVKALERSQQTSRGALEQLLEAYDAMSSQADSDRRAIDTVRQERDSFEKQMNTLDQRMVSYVQQADQWKDQVRNLNRTVAFLEKQIATSREEQAAVDKRMAVAVVERDRAIVDLSVARKHTDQAKRAQEEADTALRQAIEENEQLRTKLSVLTGHGMSDDTSDALWAEAWQGQGGTHPGETRPLDTTLFGDDQGVAKQQATETTTMPDYAGALNHGMQSTLSAETGDKPAVNFVAPALSSVDYQHDMPSTSFLPASTHTALDELFTPHDTEFHSQETVDARMTKKASEEREA